MKLKRGGYIFKKHKADHPPTHVHIYKDSKVIGKFDLENWKPMEGKITKKIVDYIEELVEKGEL